MLVVMIPAPTTKTGTRMTVIVVLATTTGRAASRPSRPKGCGQPTAMARLVSARTAVRE